MPNIKSQEKRDRTNLTSKARNDAQTNEIRTAIKKVELLVKEGKKEEAVAAYRHAASLLDARAGSGVISKNSASRKKSHLEKLVNGL